MHRQEYTEVRILEIGAASSKPAKASKKAAAVVEVEAVAEVAPGAGAGELT